MQMQHKTLSISDCEIKLDEKQGVFSGYASVFNGVDSYGDTILPGAYKNTLKQFGMPKMFLQHNSWALPIGKWIVVEEDQKGLFVQGELTIGMSTSDDTYAALKHGTLDGLSIGYMLRREDYEPSRESEGGRIIKNISRLSEISAVTFPADSNARIDMNTIKSELEEIQSIRDLEHFLRDAGCLSKDLSKALISRVKVLFGREDEAERKAKQESELAEAIKRINNTLTKI